MRQIVVRNTLLLLLPILALAANFAIAYENGIQVRYVYNNNLTDNIDFPYYGEWGWHKVHMRPLKKYLSDANLPPSRKVDVCFNCHQKNTYKICDPHTQLDNRGKIMREKCMYCHLEKPDETRVTFAVHRDEIKFIRDLRVLCLGCHKKQYALAHPVNADHVRKPSDEMLSMMKQTEEKYGVIFPLDDDGKIMCATCHNPHERGVFPDEKKAAMGAGVKDRIRLPDEPEQAGAASDEYMTRISSFASKICLACHKDKSK